ncbi:MAG TPA: sugar phosphate nucleotidyltransferase [Rhodopila sp.]
MPRATVRQCAVLIGGLGTRLGQLTATTPKPLLTCGDRPFLAWLLREFMRYGVDDFLLLTGYLPEVVQAALPAIAASLPRQVRITCSTEPVRAGTGGALYHARDHLAERFLLCNGDSMLDGNLARLLANAATDPDTITGRIMLRRLDDASRYGVVECQGDHVTAFQERPQPGSPGTINAGIYLLNRSVLDDIGPVCSLERDVLPTLATRGSLRGTIRDGYFIDIGIQSDLERAQTELPARLHRGALFLDRDALITTLPFGWQPGAIDTIRTATDAGIHVFVVVNQSEAANEARDDALCQRMGDEIRAAGGTLDDLRFARLSPQPSPDGLSDLIAKWEIDPARSIVISDTSVNPVPAGLHTIRLEGRSLDAVVLPRLAQIMAAHRP